ncbi:uncharacterized protein LOC120269326 isoform X2 [Dioscorea cayenensis subsp. rotundata]|uniref:Uncharacterized protein LOC120269326 isoform X2 n=1 Tax=Dioscorea cayennensis subsp. rotundata TaxID=55577 RepID=A0AB40C137_DIOCR|nr:uncharacterized protein LOC120269326 isoform X2 [Dioscorea cayenensis subsp. rotundata]
MRAGDDEPTGSGVAGDGGDDGHGERDEVSNRGSEDGAMRLEGETWAQVRSKTFEKGPGLYSDIRKKAKGISWVCEWGLTHSGVLKTY